MTKKQFLLLVDEILELAPGALTGAESLEELEAWGSLATISFIAMADEQFNLPIVPKSLADCKTVDDLVSLLGSSVTA